MKRRQVTEYEAGDDGDGAVAVNFPPPGAIRR
jgi:hypothetical protein